LGGGEDSERHPKQVIKERKKTIHKNLPLGENLWLRRVILGGLGGITQKENAGREKNRETFGDGNNGPSQSAGVKGIYRRS